MQSRFSDLSFIIGSFLLTIGAVVLGAYFFGVQDPSESIPVNGVGGALLASVGVLMVLGSLCSKDSNE